VCGCLLREVTRCCCRRLALSARDCYGTLVFSFRVGRIPVEVHFSHLLLSGFIALSFAQGEGHSGEWPGTILADEAHPQRSATLAIVVLLWMFIDRKSVV
jgi:hypothetical protein